MAGAANPEMVQGGGSSIPAQMGYTPDLQQSPSASRYSQASTSMDPFQQASLAQAAAMSRVGQGLTGTAASGMANYQNPYEDQVVQAALRDVSNQAAMGMNQVNSQAHQARAFGGARHGIQGAETLKGFNQQALDTAARLRQQGFTTALGASQADMATQLGAAGQLAGLGQQAFNYGKDIQNQQMVQGALQQQLSQALIDAAKGQYEGYTGAPSNALQQIISALAGAPSSAGQLAGETEKYQPGLFNFLQVAASA